MSVRGHKMSSLFAMRGGQLEYVRPGAVYRRLRPDRASEIAEILAVYADPSGIPHFRYNVMIASAHGPTVREGPRVLAAKIFLDQYGERLFQGRHETPLERRRAG